ncbi:MAG: transketolase family protein [Oscillospiraceae bacterium]|nr:transketolase family protein [Oscillospiraceae bacterium]
MSDIVKTATREAYGKALVELGGINKNVVVLDADLAEATKTIMFKKAFPDRFFDCGIAECNLIGVAAGLSTTGFTVFASSFAMFAAGRAFEQIRNTVAYPKLNVKIAATHGGISVGEDGASHQCCEDFALMRSIPGMVIINPADDIESRQAVFAAAEYEGPVYLRFGRLPVPRIFDGSYKFEIGKGVTLKKGGDVTIIATGLMVGAALEAAETLQNEGVSAAVINMPTLKPIDRDTIVEAAKKTSLIITVEEHNIIGGLGSAVAEVVCESAPVPVLRVGVNDVFGKSGPALELLDIYGLNAANIVEKVKEGIKIKG